MEDLFSIIGIVIFIFGILQIILLAKIWGMTNDIKAIKNKYIMPNTIESVDIVKQSIINIDLQTKLQVGSIVTNNKSGKQMKISKITNTGKYLCINVGSMFPEGEFDETDIELLKS